MTLFRWFGFAAVVACASVSFMGCGDSSGPAQDGQPSNAPADYSMPTLPALPDYSMPADYDDPTDYYPPEEEPCDVYVGC